MPKDNLYKMEDYRRFGAFRLIRGARLESAQKEVRVGGTSQDEDLHPLKLCDAVLDYIKISVGDVSSGLISMRKLRFRIFETKALILELKSSQPPDWKKEPVYYSALTETIKERLQPSSTEP